ncbi:uncharacterized protein DUF4132 [Prosthecobacter fusiformis]|uniref:Uncharacterized protein DUF4132 n=1 Tax=Prosthecobacter fusiformis TaxID=48464 RepID=A0A4R7SQA4_9BACT|nr:DUF4132 domain-containing protein [Prosthecobacter fusiformis]TDU81144.1 uncharacterized protein DUF4132 [Prosthecobacter fusiformis]
MNWLKDILHKIKGTSGEPPAKAEEKMSEAVLETRVAGETVSKLHHKQIQSYLDEAEPLLRNEWDRFSPKASKTGAEMLNVDCGEQAALAAALVEVIQNMDNGVANFFGTDRNSRKRRVALALLNSLLGRKLPLNEEQILTMLRWVCRGSSASSYLYPISGIVRIAEELAEEERMTEALVAGFLKFQKAFTRYAGADERRLSRRIDRAIGRTPDLPLEAGEAWTDAAIHDMSLAGKDVRDFWCSLLGHCVSATTASPSQKWMKQVEGLMEGEEGRTEFVQRMSAWLPLVNEPRTAGTKESQHVRAGTQVITDAHQDILRGLAWICGLVPGRETARLLSGLGLSAYKKMPQVGSRSVRVGNACIGALGLMGTADALGQLALLKVKLKFGGAQAAIDKALAKLAEQLGVPREELEEMSVPAYGMTGSGELVQQIGEFTAELRAISSRSTEVMWKRADGKAQKSLPAALKTEFAEDVKEFLAAKKDIEKMLPAQSERLDNLYLQRKTWPLAVWRERYCDHPLMSVLVRRLIWNFTTNGVTTPGVWLKDALVNRQGHPIELADDGSTVTLWHPLNQSADVVLGWRGFLEEWEIVQPFKQAHREVYLLTPAEEQTHVYSNRFAAHLLRQHQFNALCAARGWKNKLRLMVDDCYAPATRWLTQWGLRAEYWIEGAGTNYGTDTLESGAYRYVATDQVRFYPHDAAGVSAHAGGGGYTPNWGQAAEPLPLAEVDPLVFSEIMRDVDLFVGVASVGNDPAWLDGGRDEQQRGYWHEYGFGGLNASAQTRKAILERLVPRLKIASQCSFLDRFLLVQGKKHGYKIHLGSGNILIMPQDKYLCIVPAQGQVDKAGDKVFLPFEGDRVLSVILSKAFLLAADDKITDATILRQLK